MDGNNTIGVKLTYEGQMRRFPYTGASFSVFHEQIVALLGLEKTADIVLKYTDEENDLITISSDLELRSAIVPGQLLRIVAAPRVSAPLVSQQDQHAHMHAQQHLQAHQQHVQSHQHYQPMQTHHHQFPPQVPTPFFNAEQQRPHEQAHFGPGGNFGSFMHGCGRGGQVDDKCAKKMGKKHEKFAKKMGHHGPYGPHPHGSHPHGPHPHPYGHPHHGPHGQPWAAPSDKLVARFVTDVTIEDGTALPPLTPFVKTWRVRNEGSAWPLGCGLLFVGKKSDDMNAPAFVPIEGLVGGGQEVDISVPLIAPAKPGRYTGYFRMCTPEGKKFGQRVWVSVVIPSAAGDSSSEGEKEADKYEALVDIVLRNEAIRSSGVKRHWVFRLLQKYDGDVEKVTRKLEKRLAKKNKCHKK